MLTSLLDMICRLSGSDDCVLWWWVNLRPVDESTYEQWMSQLTNSGWVNLRAVYESTASFTPSITTTNFFPFISTYHHNNLAFDGVNIYSVGDKMTKKGWSLNALQSPACLHICCTVAHLGHHDEFIADLKASGRWVIAIWLWWKQNWLWWWWRWRLILQWYVD